VSSEPGGGERQLARLRSWQRWLPEFSSLGYELAFVSTVHIAEQRRWIAGSSLSLTLLSDVGLRIAAALRLPTVEVDGRSVFDDVTVVLHGGEVNQVFYESREPQNDAETVLRFLRRVHDGPHGR
jgi:peroxiredoxin